MAFTEFYCNGSTGSNTNAGSTEAAPLTPITSGSWVSVTGVFTKAGANLSAISVGMFAAVMVDAGTVAAVIGRITAVDDTLDTVTVSTTAKSGSLADQTNTATLTVGGPWKGPNGAVAFPFTFVTTALTNAAADIPRVNLKNNATYAITAEMNHTSTGPVQFQGYTATAGDFGRAIIDGGAVGASFTLLRMTAANIVLADIIFQNNGATGSEPGLIRVGTEGVTLRVVVNNFRGHGLSVEATYQTLIEVEAYACNTSNTASLAGIACTSANSRSIRCISHDNTGSNALGFIATVSGDFSHCIADSNGAQGFLDSSPTRSSYTSCDCYSNGSDGIGFANVSQAAFYVENCNFIKNGGYGINGSGAGARVGAVVNCGFGSGTQVNTSGTTTGLKSMEEKDSITYAANVTPWVDPANGDFRINLSTAKGTGRGTFMQTAASYAGTVGYPDVGAAQHIDAGGAPCHGSMSGGLQ